MTQVRCPHCNIALSLEAIGDGWCPYCGKKIPGYAQRPLPTLTPVPRPPVELRRRGSGGKLSVLLAAAALLISLLALFLIVFRDPFGPVYRMNWRGYGDGLAGYDFSNASAAYKSELQIEHNRDIRAVIEINQRTRDKELKEKIDT